MKKRIISVCLVVALAVSSCLTALAQDVSKDNDSLKVQVWDVKTDTFLNNVQLSEKTKQTLDRDLTSLKEIGLFHLADELVVKSTDNSLVYEGMFGEYKNTIYIVQNDENSLKMVISQNDITNRLEIRKDGTYIVDGNVLEFEKVDSSTDTIMEASAEDVAPRSVEVMNKIVKNCPYGSASAYTHSLGTKKNANVALEKEIAKLAISTFATILCGQLGVGSIVGDVYSALYGFLVDCDPTTKGLSYKTTNYAHKNYTNTYITPIKKYVFKSCYTWYTDPNYTGSTEKSTVYQTREFI